MQPQDGTDYSSLHYENVNNILYLIIPLKWKIVIVSDVKKFLKWRIIAHVLFSQYWSMSVRFFQLSVGSKWIPRTFILFTKGILWLLTYSECWLYVVLNKFCLIFVKIQVAFPHHSHNCWDIKEHEMRNQVFAHPAKLPKCHLQIN